MVRVIHPEDLVEYRYRVMQVAPTSSTDRSAFVYETREFRTLKAAKACEKRWIAEGHYVIRQTARIQWMTPEELKQEIERLESK